MLTASCECISMCALVYFAKILKANSILPATLLIEHVTSRTLSSVPTFALAGVRIPQLCFILSMACL